MCSECVGLGVSGSTGIYCGKPIRYPTPHADSICTSEASSFVRRLLAWESMVAESGVLVQKFVAAVSSDQRLIE